MDVMLITIGSICAIINGGIFPGQIIILGQLISTFIDHAKGKGVNVTNPVDMDDEMKLYSQLYVYLAILAWVAGYIQCAFWSISAIRQIHKIRLRFFKSIMRQNIGWFDENEGGGVTTRMFEYVYLYFRLASAEL